MSHPIDYIGANITAMSSTVSQWYEGKHIFITGATGFMGKVLVEKLLRSTNIEKIFVLVRPKRGQSAEERIKKLISLPLFDHIKLHCSKSLDKLYCITGDVAERNLGINRQELENLRENVNVVFHVAANVKFQEPLKTAVHMNLNGSYNMLELARNFKKLSVYVHVSTSYCQVNEKVLEEKMYTAPHNPRKVLDLMTWLDNDTIQHITPYLTKGYPNTYAYTKCLTEELVGEYTPHMRIAIVRPSLVTASCSEPIPGWTDNFNGLTGFLVGGGKGIIRSILCNPTSSADLVPVDITINRIIIVAKETSDNEHHKEKPLVVNLTANSNNSITWEEVLEVGKKHIYDNPYSVMLWYPNGGFTTSRFWHMIRIILFHYLPAYIIDLLLNLFGKKPFLVSIQDRICKGLSIIAYYTNREWIFDHQNIHQIYSKLSKEEKEAFNCDMSKINWDDYILSCVLGTRLYLMHEDPASIPQARSLLFRMYMLDLIAKVGLLGVIIFIIYRCILSYLIFWF